MFVNQLVEKNRELTEARADPAWNEFSVLGAD
jgi:hypothetical protein